MRMSPAKTNTKKTAICRLLAGVLVFVPAETIVSYRVKRVG